MTSDAAPTILVIGYGSELRGDDCAGRRAVEAIDEIEHHRDGPRIVVRSVHQLTPDLAPFLAEADMAIFVDACADEIGDIRLRRLTPDTPILGDPHTSSPSGLLGLAKWIYGRCPKAWSIDIAAFDFSIGDAISEGTESAIRAAVVVIDNLIREQEKHDARSRHYERCA